MSARSTVLSLSRVSLSHLTSRKSTLLNTRTPKQQVQEAASPEHAPKHMFEAVQQATQQVEDMKHLDEDMRKMRTHHAELREHMKGLISEDSEKNKSVEDKLADMEDRALLAEKRL